MIYLLVILEAFHRPTSDWMREENTPAPLRLDAAVNASAKDTFASVEIGRRNEETVDMSHTGFWVSKSQIVGEASPRRAATRTGTSHHHVALRGRDAAPRPRAERRLTRRDAAGLPGNVCAASLGHRPAPGSQEAALERPGAPPPGNTAPAAVSVRPRCAVARGASPGQRSARRTALFLFKTIRKKT